MEEVMSEVANFSKRTERNTQELVFSAFAYSRQKGIKGIAFAGVVLGPIHWPLERQTSISLWFTASQEGISIQFQWAETATVSSQLAKRWNSLELTTVFARADSGIEIGPQIQ